MYTGNGNDSPPSSSKGKENPLKIFQGIFAQTKVTPCCIVSDKAKSGLFTGNFP
jgi:hypothetical protein